MRKGCRSISDAVFARTNQGVGLAMQEAKKPAGKNPKGHKLDGGDLFAMQMRYEEGTAPLL